MTWQPFHQAMLVIYMYMYIFYFSQHNSFESIDKVINRNLGKLVFCSWAWTQTERDLVNDQAQLRPNDRPGFRFETLSASEPGAHKLRQDGSDLSAENLGRTNFIRPEHCHGICKIRQQVRQMSLMKDKHPLRVRCQLPKIGKKYDISVGTNLELDRPSLMAAKENQIWR